MPAAPPGGGDAATGGAVGRVLGTVDATPLQFYVGLAPGRTLQLDDVVVTERELPDAGAGDARRAW